MRIHVATIFVLVTPIYAFLRETGGVGALRTSMVPRSPEVFVLDMTTEKKSKRQIALKTLKRVASVAGTVALTTGSANAAATASAAVESTIRYRKYIGGGLATAAITSLIGKGILESDMDSPATGATLEKMQEAFPGAVTNKSLVNKVRSALKKYNYGKKNTLFTSSLCTDEANRCLEWEFSKVYGDAFSIGGLAGFPFGGITAFGHMASHIPDGGSCLIVFGPHIGIDGDGAPGTVDRRGLSNGPCCDVAISASQYAIGVHNGEIKANKRVTPIDALDAQQGLLKSLLIPFGARLDNSPETMIELPYALYDSQKEMMTDIVKTAASSVSQNGKIAVLGGIQINTNPGISDYYLPLSLEVYDHTGKKLDDLML